MAPFEALYGRKCRTPRCGMKSERKGGEVEQDRRKLNPDEELCGWRRRELSFEEGDSVYPKVSPIRGTKRFQVRGKLAPRYVGPYKIVRRIGKVAYKLELPNRCVTYTTCSTYLNSKVPESTGPTSEPGRRRVTTRPSLSRETNQDFGHGHPEDTDYNNQDMRVLWSRHGEEEATWEREDALGKNTPICSKTNPISRTRSLLRG
ncbi:hypothetical protein U9M48_018022 [Paspalum notatum var. saurae]|uniref:Tf2-1-like SH3-like domain-containing protein n=1 Tax=Paspalum notatum var. saurae TaxID=547442 RepID=A0AAQ3T987_PASNO